MFADNPELTKMMDMIEHNDYVGLEDYTYHLLNQVADENLIMEVWITDSRRSAIRFSLSVLYADPTSVKDVNDQGNKDSRGAQCQTYVQKVHLSMAPLPRLRRAR